MNNIIGSIGYYLGFPSVRHIVFSREQQQQILREVPNLNELLENYKDRIIFGGSRIVRLFTRRSFPVDDTDIFISIRVEKSTEDSVNDVIDTLSRIYQTTPDKFVAKLTKDHPGQSLVDPNNKDVEEFDKAIIGTVNYKHPYCGKLQFVLVDYRSPTLHEWYENTSDLPVYAYDDNGSFNFRFTGTTHSMRMLKNGFFCDSKRPTHSNRVQKYQSKGFHFL